MAYYVATDKFGNYDLCHYGVKGMKWGEVNEDPLVGRLGASYAVNKAQADGMKRTQVLKAQQQASSAASGGSASNAAKNNSAASSNAKIDPKVQQQYAASVSAKTEEKIKEETKAEDDDAKKIADANAKYQSALMNMQMLARVAQSNGVSLGQSPEYLAARKEVIKTKYELDKLTIEQQEKAASQPEPTYAEQKQEMDSEAREQLAEDKKKASSSSSNKLDDIHQKQREILNSYGIRAADRKGGKSK